MFFIYLENDILELVSAGEEMFYRRNREHEW